MFIRGVSGLGKRSSMLKERSHSLSSPFSSPFLLLCHCWLSSLLFSSLLFSSLLFSSLLSQPSLHSSSFFLSDTPFISVNINITSMPKLGFILNYDNNIKITHTWNCDLSEHACIHWTTERLRWGKSFLLFSKFTLTCVLEDFWTACLLSVATFVSVYLRQ